MVTSLEEAFTLVSSKFKIPTLNYQQKLAIEKIVSNKKNVFVNQCLPALQISYLSSASIGIDVNIGRGELPFSCAFGKARKTRPKG